ncbi:hypothetical protein ACFST9_24475 [Hymenobacter monticola]|uniref:Tetratricopeptide repeat protein n=1 Tax=Hymenobacter monticola TaxID=1705399 RepID=A0ABY4B7N0_9BACT|nr:hypothetical protein [Hymenobacter monticola]UOE34869.1 hypothetical protein MTP16_04255 [Hymenobacter monticola]
MGFLSFFNRKPAGPVSPAVREVLFGDVPVLEWPRPDAPHRQEPPWSLFAAAQDAYRSGDAAAAIAALQQVLDTPGLESRHYLQAWHFLRTLGVAPSSDEARRVLGVVVEVSLPEGLDLVVAYADLTARYYNHSGAGVVWEMGNDLADAPIQNLLAAGQTVVNVIGPSQEARRAAPPTGHVRVNSLTAGGLYFGEGPFNTLFNDPLASPVIAGGLALMQALIAYQAENPPAEK